MVPDLEDIDLVDQSAPEQQGLGGRLSVAGEERVECAVP